MKNVFIIQRRLTHYRVPFFQALKNELIKRDVNLKLLYGSGTAQEAEKQDEGEIPWATRIPTRYFLGERLCWQPVHRYLKDADLVIVTQENALLANYLLMFMPRKFKLAFWGHGANFQSTKPDGLKERFKRWTTNQVDWWFAYTQLSADLVKDAGFPDNYITVVNNAVDTSELRRQWESVTPDEKQSLRESLGFGQGHIGIFIGSLHCDKRLDFLLSACDAIKKQVQDFQLLLVGDGPEREKVQAWCNTRSWGQWLGVKLGRDKACCLALADIMLNPGLVGLGILDSFVCAVPMITADCGIHSPEIGYLENGINGIMTAEKIERYVYAVVGTLTNLHEYNKLQRGCYESAETLTIENMMRKFSNGISAALSA